MAPGLSQIQAHLEEQTTEISEALSENLLTIGETKNVFFEIHKDSYIYTVLGYTEESPEAFFETRGELGIAVKDDWFKVKSNKIDIELESFFQENQVRIDWMVFRWFRNLWANLKLELNAEIMIHDSVGSLDLQSGHWFVDYENADILIFSLDEVASLFSSIKFDKALLDKTAYCGIDSSAMADFETLLFQEEEKLDGVDTDSAMESIKLVVNALYPEDDTCYGLHTSTKMEDFSARISEIGIPIRRINRSDMDALQKSLTKGK